MKFKKEDQLKMLEWPEELGASWRRNLTGNVFCYHHVEILRKNLPSGMRGCVDYEVITA